MLNVPLANIFEALQVNLGSVYVNDFNLFGRTFQVRAQADGSFRKSPEDIRLLKTRNSMGQMVPLGSVLNVEWRSGPDRVVRYNMFPGAEVQGDSAPGYSSGDAIAAIERLAGEKLPDGMQIAWTDLAYQEQLAGNTALFIFPLCVLFVFLVHSAEYESWSLPMAIILIAPVCLPFALGGVWGRGMDNNLITQIGFVVLIGLAAKNAVLIVEFAKQLEEEGSKHHRCRGRSLPSAAPPDPYDLVCVHSRRAASCHSDWAWRRVATGPRHCSIRRNARRNLFRSLPHAGVLRHSPTDLWKTTWASTESSRKRGRLVCARG